MILPLVFSNKVLGTECALSEIASMISLFFVCVKSDVRVEQASVVVFTNMFLGC